MAVNDRNRLLPPGDVNAAYMQYINAQRNQAAAGGTDTGTAVPAAAGVKPFQYNFNEDALYQQAAQRYQQMGRQAMMDTMGHAQTMTGGYGNSYAQNAGQQAYQGYLQGLHDNLPQYQQMAMDKYKMDYSQYQDNQKLAQGQVDYLLSIGVQPDDQLLAMAGYSKQYVDNVMKPQAVGGGGGGSGGGGGGTGSGTTGSKGSRSGYVIANEALGQYKNASSDDKEKYLAAMMKAGAINGSELQALRDIWL